MHKTWIKVCGITRHEDALAAAEFGADAIGLNFYKPSPRAITVAEIEGVLGAVNKDLTTVALFVDHSRAEIEAVIASGKIDLLQFHGDESPAFCASFNMAYMKAFRVGRHSNLEEEIKRYDSAQMILLDSYDKKAPGGTGKTFDWNTATQISELINQPMVLAGGLDPSNVAVAIQNVSPFGVDVSSGVESAPGIKDSKLVKEFIEGARSDSS